MANIVVFTCSVHVVVDVKLENPLLDHYQNSMLPLPSHDQLFIPILCGFDF